MDILEGRGGRGFGRNDANDQLHIGYVTMTKKTEYRGISKRARLLLSREEGYDVEFKLSLGGLDPQDMVAFANSEMGGAILVGVEDVRTGSGRQRGVIQGCSIVEK